jgi:aryl-alcohol dehydrogenase-like predicted oxidoreductase
MDRLKREGKIRAFGLSLRDKGPEEANDLIRWRQVDSLQIFFNLLYQDPLWKVLPLAKEYGVGIIARVPLAYGALSGRFTAQTRFIGDDHRRNLYAGEALLTTLKKVEKLKFLSSKAVPLPEASLKWLLAHPEVSTCIPGIRNLKQAVVNCSAGDGKQVPAAAVLKAESLYKRNFGLPIKDVPSPDGVHAVFMSGVRIVPGLKSGDSTSRKAKAKTPKTGRTKKAKTQTRKKREK